jgi:hypothetical protein
MAAMPTRVHTIIHGHIIAMPAYPNPIILYSSVANLKRYLRHSTTADERSGFRIRGVTDGGDEGARA